MVKIQDFVIAGLLAFAVLFGAAIIVSDFDNSYELGISNVNETTAVNLTRMDDLLYLTQDSEGALNEEKADESSGLISGVINAYTVAKKSISAIPIVGSILWATSVDFGIPGPFIAIAVAIMMIVIIFLLIALMTGRFV